MSDQDELDRLRRENAALSAALVETPMPSMIDNDAPGSEEANLTLTWPKKRVFDWWATREPDLATAKRILSAHDAAIRRPLLEALAESRRVLEHDVTGIIAPWINKTVEQINSLLARYTDDGRERK